MRKPKTQQKKNVNEVSGRDLFQTPNYAVDLLIPFLNDIVPMSPYKSFRIWECAAGLGKIVNRLKTFGFDIYGSDLESEDFPKHNFLTQSNGQDFDCIVTNTPFSLKRDFYLQCLSYQKPFALLIPADYSGWIIKAVQDGAEKIIPTRRIDYITPNILMRIWQGETWEIIKEEMDLESPLITMEMYIDSYPMEWQHTMVENKQFKFNSIYDAPVKLLRKYSSSYYHSMWLTWGFNLGRTETFVELTNEMKDNI
jgi:hypothetical protein